MPEPISRAVMGGAFGLKTAQSAVAIGICTEVREMKNSLKTIPSIIYKNKISISIQLNNDLYGVSICSNFLHFIKAKLELQKY